MKAVIAIRPMQAYDTPFVFSSWLRSYKACRDKHVDPSIYFTEHHKVIDAILARTDIEVRIATPIDDPDTILGWCVKTNDALHYVYVKEAFRRMGLAKELVGHFTSHSHLTPYGSKALGGFLSVYNPYLAMTR